MFRSHSLLRDRSRTGRLARQARSAARGDPRKEIQMSMAGNLRKVTARGAVGGLRKVARLTRRRPRVDLSHPARSPLGSAGGQLRGLRGRCADSRGQRPGRHRAPDPQVRDEGFVWLGLHEPTDQEFAGIAELFDLHPLAVEDAVEAHQRPKMERYGDTLFAVFKTVCYVEHEELTATSEVVEHRRDHGVRRPGLRHHRAPRTARLAGPAARGTGVRTRSSCPRGRPRCCTRSRTTSSTTT